MIWKNGVAFRDNNVGTDLSPFLWDRLREYMREPAIHGNVWVSSGSRTFAQQLWLYTKWRLRWPGYNLAANPYRTIGTCSWADPPFVAKGSWHMVQKSTNPNYAGAGAVDLSWSGITVQTMHTVAQRYGLQFLIPTEDWHAQPYNTARIFEAPIIIPPIQGAPIVTTFGNATFTEAYIDEEVIVLYLPLIDDEGDNFHIINRETETAASHRHGVVGDRLADVRRRGSTLMLSVRRGGNGYHTLPVPIP